MRQVPAHFDTVWNSGDFIGDNKASRRVTIQRPFMRLDTFAMQTTFRRVPALYGDVQSFNPYPSGIDPSKGDPCTQIYADYFFTAPEAPKELPNVASIDWARSVDVDCAQATIEFWNTAPLPIGEVPVPGTLDLPGYFSPNRGSSAFSSRWGHNLNAWTNLLMPDNILRTYEGWGMEMPAGVEIGGFGYVPPERDGRMIQTGLWIIDEVKLSSTGRITVTARDSGRLLLDHSSMIPVVPEDFYPVSFKDWGDQITLQSQRTVVNRRTDIERLNIWHIGSGNDHWPESAYNGAKAYGHSSTHAFDGNQDSYYLSVGNPKVTYRSAYEYLDIGVSGTVSEIHFWTVKSGYNAYVSVEVNGSWLPGTVMPYHQDGRGRYEEGIPYAAYAGGLANEGEHVIALGLIEGVTRVRLWLGNLQNFGLPGSKYRAGIREVALYGPVQHEDTQVVTDSQQAHLTPGPAGSNPGRVRDYTDIPKLFCAWAGLYWPGDAYVLHSDGLQYGIAPSDPDDETLGAGVTGRVWGDWQATGTAPIDEIIASAFDKKTLMDGVRYIADIVGFHFYFDETGAAQWRLPNIWSLGNWVGGLAATPGRTRAVVTIDERKVILNLDATLQSRNVREGVFVANMVGKYAAIVPGYNPNYTGLRRIGGWTDSSFASVDEARTMAELVAVRQMFRYREDRVVIPAHPAIQIDDQVRVFERVTSEGYYHYITGISSHNGADTGQWQYTLQTHWLGDDPNGQWIFNKADLSSNTIAYVDSLQQGALFMRAGMEV